MEIPQHVRVVFELPACTWTTHIFLVGDFNQWNPKATPFEQDRNGVWRASIDLQEGSQQAFRYCLDGCWHTDLCADSWSTTVQGLQNSMIIAALSV